MVDWHLRPELEYTHHVDSWHVRQHASFDADIVCILKSGENFKVLSSRDEWVQVMCSTGETGWSHTKFGETEALAPVTHGIQVLDSPQRLPEPEPLQRQSSVQDRLRATLAELAARRLELESLQESGNLDSLVSAASGVQASMAKLELLGVEKEHVLAIEGADALAKVDNVMTSLCNDLQRKTSFDHADFVNPEAASCWLSTFFQSLWHSRVFHAIFDRLVKPLPPETGGDATKALRETWELYEKAAKGGDLVSVSALVRAWGSGYGDCSDAFANLRADAALQPLTEQLNLVPVPFDGTTLTPVQLWQHVLDSGFAQSPLIVVDLELPPLSQACILTFTLALTPHQSKAALGQSPPDIGDKHQLVAMICYMPTFSHYVVFCRRLSETHQWLFFNDLPGLARGALQELPSWPAVAHACARFELVPKLLLYESSTSVVLEGSPKVWATVVSAQPERRQTAWSGKLLQGLSVCVLVVIVAAILQQTREIYQLASKSQTNNV